MKLIIEEVLFDSEKKGKESILAINTTEVNEPAPEENRYLNLKVYASDCPYAFDVAGERMTGKLSGIYLDTRGNITVQFELMR